MDVSEEVFNESFQECLAIFPNVESCKTFEKEFKKKFEKYGEEFSTKVVEIHWPSIVLELKYLGKHYHKFDSFVEDKKITKLLEDIYS